MSKRIDLTGQTFGRLSVLEISPELSPDASRKWFCKCECGRVVAVITASLRRGLTKSCGCLQREIRLKQAERIRDEACKRKMLVRMESNDKWGRW